ncbi:MAG: hypothetical protein NVS9B10_13510 [Nevskia sp.]
MTAKRKGQAGADRRTQGNPGAAGNHLHGGNVQNSMLPKARIALRAQAVGSMPANLNAESPVPGVS